jgi:Raf kinase inhibitor-like YbhB/YbcL family protein
MSTRQMPVYLADTMTAPREDSGNGTFRLSSSALTDGAPIPQIFTCEGKNQSLPLAWTGVPVSTRSFALIADDPDAPRGTWVHWLIWNLPADACELGTGVPTIPELPSGARQGANDGGDLGYQGPCPPPGRPHRYFFRLFALDISLNLAPGADRSALEAAYEGHVLARAVLMGTYQRSRS